ncbi:hypothetical protein [Merismopedia glauca]|uniref:Uncharacterized protein n=1 Tax=Merismopedia glauca CCAP 1448/3 TaxID=1296344 RepID=A0A2T1BY91_9CYAN|nr:hypothetical protein [Merismopedia glauca]PSB00996.1 hypothetical protein C7B64_20590 [Merismopedia glauca CCAP 1448/3]
MSQKNSKPIEGLEKDEAKSRDSTGFILSLATAPFLVTFLAAEKLLELLLVTGHASEEIFRGDRLPVLNFPTTSDKSDG